MLIQSITNDLGNYIRWCSIIPPIIIPFSLFGANLIKSSESSDLQVCSEWLCQMLVKYGNRFINLVNTYTNRFVSHIDNSNRS